MEESLDHDEWVGWLEFYGLYDLPDAYFMAQVFAAHMTGTEAKKVTAIYEPERNPGGHGIPEFVAFATGYMRSPDRHGYKQVPKSKPRPPGPPVRPLPAAGGDGA